MKQELQRKLAALIKKECLEFGDVELHSGGVSGYKIHLDRLSEEGWELVGKLGAKLLEEALGIQLTAIGGPDSGGLPVARAIALKHPDNPTIFRVSKTRRIFREDKEVAGDKDLPFLRTNALVVDDVATTGRSLVDAVNALNSRGLDVAGVLVVVNRGDGEPEEALKRKGLKMISILAAEDVLNALR